MRLWNSLLVIVFVIISGACSQKEFRFYSDPSYEKLVEQEFAERRIMASNRADELFGVLDLDLTEAEKQGLKFLYAFMPLNDLADYSGDYFLKQVRSSLAARDTFQWGKSIPESEFRHFVLPYRINNENLDTARQVFFEELKDRIKHMDMLEAALEVNHWCHEKVSYRGTDIRTSAPLATVKTAYGRCGEESTFTVAALRSVAIPARQVYTPRWAHSDDNHAWVEFWANGKWYYMGACEPEPVPDYGWFTEPARRAMLVHTKAFGNYQGNERIANQEQRYAWLNTLPVYAPVKELFVKVLDENGNDLEDAEVEFQLYNYAEFYPIATKKTKADGLCSFLTGLGDLQVWAHQGNAFNYAKISVADVDTLLLMLDQKPFKSKLDSYDIHPPIERKAFQIAQEGKKQNALRLKQEDAIRAAYEATFMTGEEAGEWAKKLDLDPDELTRFIELSRGNYAEIAAFLTQVPNHMRSLAMLLLDEISLKDLRDTRQSVLLDHLYGAYPFAPEHPASDPMYLEYVLNPRVSTEMLVAYRQYLTEAWSEEEIAQFSSNPEKLIAWLRTSIQLNNEENYYQTALTPVGTMELKLADEFSLKILSVAALRTFGIPARLEPGTEFAQYYRDGIWTSFYFGKQDPVQTDRGRLILLNDPRNSIDPRYHIHFTLAKFQMGKYLTLHYEWDKPLADFSEGVNLDAGYYLLITGNRLPGGAVLHEQEFFEINPGEEVTKIIRLRTNDQKPEVIASLDLNVNYLTIDNRKVSLNSGIGKPWMVIAWIDPDKEPSKHTIQDLGFLKKELDALNLPFTFIIPEGKLTESFRRADYSNLPSDHQFLVASELDPLSKLSDQLHKDLINQLPVFVICNEAGEISYMSTGYKIGIGEEIVKFIR